MRLLVCLLTMVVMSGAVASDYEAELDAWRKTRLERLTAEESWTSLVGLHWIDRLKPSSIGSAADNQIVIAGLPAHFATLERGPDGKTLAWYLTFADDVETEVDGQSAQGRIVLRTDQEASRAGARATKVRHGSIAFILIERADRVGLRVWDANVPARVHFAGIESFPVAADWRVTAQWAAHEPPGTIDIATVIGTVEPMANPGAAVFERNGQRYRLEALREEGSDQLFFIFADRTSGKSTYGAGRYLYAALPGEKGTVVLDFNRAYNPPCAFSEFATCPLPPPENRLDLAIEAGEKAYRKPKVK